MRIDYVEGDQVVCLEDNWEWKGDGPNLGIYLKMFPVKGGVYTVREIIDYSKINGRNDLGIRLEEIINPIIPHIGEEPTFLADYFRRCKDTNIDVFLNILNKENQKGKVKEREKIDG